MASLLALHASRARLWQLPPTLRPSLYAQSLPLPRRNFSASATRQLSAHNVAIAGPTAIFDAIHATGLPWWATIPIAAVLVRCCLIYSVNTAPTQRRRVAIRRQFAPLAQLLAKERAQLDQFNWLEKAHQRQAQPFPPGLINFRYKVYLLIRLFQENRRLGAKFNAPLFSWITIANPVVFLSFGEAIRTKAGGEEGLLSVILKPIEAIINFFTEKTNLFTEKTNEPILSPSATIASRWDGESPATDLSSLGDGFYQLMPLASPAHEQSQAALANVDPTMLTEGLWWFQNLTVPDPTILLPVALGASVLVGVFNRDSRVVEPAKREVKMDDIRTNKDSHPSSLAENAENAGNAPKGQAMDDVNAALAKADEIRAASAKGGLRGERSLIPAAPTLGRLFRIVVSLVYFAMALYLPAGVLLYIVPFIVSGRILNKWHSIRNPVPPLIKPCRRPMRIKIRRMFRDA